MIIEFVGCTGAGKATLARVVSRRLQACGCRVQGRWHTGSSTLVTVRNALLTPVALLRLVRDRSRYGACLKAMLRALRWREASPLWSIARASATVRALGHNARYLRAPSNEVNIVDEGVLGTAHLAFWGDTFPSLELLDDFLTVVPLADVVVWVDAPLEALEQRAQTRPDLLRELRGRPPAQVRARLANLQAVFRALAQAPPVAARLVPAWNPQASPEGRAALAEDLTEELCRRIDGRCP